MDSYDQTALNSPEVHDDDFLDHWITQELSQVTDTTIEDAITVLNNTTWMHDERFRWWVFEPNGTVKLR